MYTYFYKCIATELRKPGFVETWDFPLFSRDGVTHSLSLHGRFLSQSCQKLQNSVAFTLFSNLTEMHQHV